MAPNVRHLLVFEPTVIEDSLIQDQKGISAFLFEGTSIGGFRKMIFKHFMSVHIYLAPSADLLTPVLNKRKGCNKRNFN